MVGQDQSGREDAAGEEKKEKKEMLALAEAFGSTRRNCQNRLNPSGTRAHRR